MLIRQSGTRILPSTTTWYLAVWRIQRNILRRISDNVLACFELWIDYHHCDYATLPFHLQLSNRFSKTGAISQWLHASWF